MFHHLIRYVYKDIFIAIVLFYFHQASISKDSDFRTLSIASRDDNHVRTIAFLFQIILYLSLKENNRSRLDSASSDVSQFSLSQNPNNYVSPLRQFMPPSDLESEYGGDESDHEANTVKFPNENLENTSFFSS